MQLNNFGCKFLLPPFHTERRKGLKITLKYKLPKQLSKLEAKPHWIENTYNLPVTRGFKTNCRDFLRREKR